MRGPRRVALATVTAVLACASAAHAASYDGDRYALANGCFTLHAGSAYVAPSGDGWGVTGTAADATPFTLKAVTLGREMLYAPDRSFLASAGGTLSRPTDPDIRSDWTIDKAGPGSFRVTATQGGAPLGGKDAFAFEPATGCTAFPEAQVDATGDPSTGPTPYSQVSGFIDAHMHWMGFEFLGGDVHCGRPWDAYGITKALAGCDPKDPQSPAIETALGGGSPGDDPVGWPTFKSWPGWNKLTHEQSYYKWVERAWRGGLRIFVNLFVENNALCMAAPNKRNGCNEMDSVRLQAKDLRNLQDYVDAQYGGPGKGWLRIVSDPFEARRVANAGKLAVVPGIEVSDLFDCGERGGVSPCTDAQVDQRLDEAYDALGVRDMELINKFDNGFAGVAGDEGTTGNIVNTGNYIETGNFWDMKTCTGPPEEHDRLQTAPKPGTLPPLISQVLASAPGGTIPLYPPGPHCNQRPLTQLGEHLVNRMIDKRMIIDPDHLDVLSRKRLLDIVESRGYHGVVSSHSWSSADAYPRILKDGGFVAPYAGNSTDFAAAWKTLRAQADPRYLWGIGWGADMNGFGHQGMPRPGNAANPVHYPFKSFDGKVTLDRQVTGGRTFDINTDGVAHYGLYPDWVEDLRQIAGPQIVTDLSRGAEAYLEMSERGVGIAPEAPRSRRLRFTSTGLGALKLGAPPEDALRAGGQPHTRVARTWTYKVRGGGRDTVAFDARGRVKSVSSTAAGHRYLGVGRGSEAPKGAPRNGRYARRLGRRSQVVVAIRGGRVRSVTLART